MKALSKGKAAEFFKKQQKKQDPQQILNQAEARTIAGQVGIAEQQINEFKWFFDQLSKFKLPQQYEKQLNQKKTHITYYNKTTKTSSQTHPLINTIRTFFYNEYKSNRSAFTFVSKKEKLLPYVQEKMMKNCISLNSKRREVQKLNLQKDENGNVVLSKMARLKPDMKSLVSARSYMLKMLVDKVFTCKEIWGKGKRAKSYANIISEKQKGAQDEEDVIEESPQDLQTYQSIFTQSSRYYEQEYGDLTKIPSHILSSQSYKNSTPQNVLRNIFLLNISKNHIQFYWFARLMDCLTIPHNWSVQLSSNVESYIYEPLKIKFDIHPSYIYIIKQMNKFKDFFCRLKDEEKVFYYKDRQMTFFDFFEREYIVDMYGFVLKEELKLQGTEETEQKSDLNKKKSMQDNTNDWMIVQALVNTDIQPEEYVLIGQFCDFWRSKYFPEEEWIPSVSPFGQVTWSNTVNYSSIDYCPYKEDLIRKVEAERKKIPSIKKEDFKPHLQNHICFQEDGKIKIEEETQADIQFNKIFTEKQNFVKHYIENFGNQVHTPIDIGTFDTQDYFDQIFICPFELDSPTTFNPEMHKNKDEEPQQVPVWMQKVRARKFSARIKNSIRQGHDFAQIFEEVKQYTIENTVKHEPQKMEEIKEKLRNVKNYKELESLLNNVTNIDAREERKRKAFQLMNQQSNKEDDIFGSEEEDINISQAEVNQSEEEEQEELEQEDDSESSQKAQQVSESQSQENVDKKAQVIVEENPVEQDEQAIQREDYSFLKEFKTKKIYQKMPDLENADQKKLEIMIKGQIKNKKKQQKYSNSYIKTTLSYQLKKNNQLIRDQQQIQNIKKNLIATNLKYSTVPYKNKNLITFKDNKNAQEYLQNKNLGQIEKLQGFQNMTEFNVLENSQFVQRFQSEMGEYQAEEVVQQIKNLPKKEIIQENVEQKDEQNIEIQVKLKKKKEEVQIVFQPLKRTKPDILQDQRLRHINDLDIENQMNTLSSIFLKKSQSLADSPIKLRMKSKSISNLTKGLESTQNSSLQKSISLLRSTPKKFNENVSGFDSVKNLKSQKMIEDKLFPQISCFNRVCLDHTASKFLGSEPIKRTSELLVLQARKNLLHKGRGLETYLSKKY